MMPTGMPGSVGGKILIVAYHFPPAITVGGIRPAKFAKFLSRFGWRPFVLTIAEDHLGETDPGRLEDVRGVPILRTRVFPTILQLAVRLKHAFLPPRPLAFGEQPASRRVENLNRGPVKRSPRTLNYTLNRILTSIFELPDREVGWLLPAIWNGYRLIKNEEIQVILCTSPPATAALVGAFLSRLTGARLILDLRDPWDLHAAKGQDVRTRLSDRIEQRLEGWLTRSADRVITATEHYTAFLQAHFSDLPKNTFQTIWNGFDADDFTIGKVRRKDDRTFVLSYLGTFYMGRTPKELLQAVGSLIRNHRIGRDEIRIHFLGEIHEAEGVPIMELIRQNDLNGCVRLSKAVPYKESIAQMQQSDVLLLFAPQQYYAIPGKAFEYLAAHRPILCVGDTGATADLIRHTGSGIVVDPRDVNEIEAAIWRLYSAWKINGRSTIQTDVRQFERSVLTQRLAAILDELVAESPRKAFEGSQVRTVSD
jgi:glycosyltransferase involved in cell wall biosynthesis